MRPRSGMPSLFVTILLVVTMLDFVAASPARSAPTSDDPETPTWSWPVTGPRSVVARYRAPAHRYGAGHRGVDLSAAMGTTVSAPADGVVTFRGTVVDRQLITIEHAGGLVSTFEPLRSDLVVGDLIAEGQEIGVVDAGGHTPPGAIHLGVRLDGDYINPMLLFGGVPRAVLLPCCEAP